MRGVVNQASILAKINNFVASDEFKSRVNQVVNDAFLGKKKLSNPGANFYTQKELNDSIKELQSSLARHIHGYIDSYSEGDIGVVSVKSDGVLQWTGGINFNNVTRPSLDSKYRGADNIVSLFSKGWDAGGRRVFGFWRGKYVSSRPRYAGNDMVGAAIAEFKASHPGLQVEYDTSVY